MFLSNNRASLQLWWKENLLKYQKVLKYYENDCRYVQFIKYKKKSNKQTHKKNRHTQAKNLQNSQFLLNYTNISCIIFYANLFQNPNYLLLD